MPVDGVVINAQQRVRHGVVATRLRFVQKLLQFLVGVYILFKLGYADAGVIAGMRLCLTLRDKINGGERGGEIVIA